MPRGYHAYWNISNRERQTLYDITYMWNLNNQQPQICRWHHFNGRKWRGNKELLDEGESPPCNQSVLVELSPEHSLEGLMLKLKLQYFGHLMWKTGSFEKRNSGKGWRREEKWTSEDEMVGCQEAFNRRLPVCCFESVKNSLFLRGEASLSRGLRNPGISFISVSIW